ncbi:MAG TPA: competence/damage-inducible protein A [Abditibacteriaceae bacterium]|nr:competence/damage-inducible protein A [Abditibacteriaceae bacterium]
MRAEILCVGSELLLGQIIDTNAVYIATQLARAGIDLHRKQTVGDNLERITDCIRGALGRSHALIITGGLGPTTDDLTREAIAGALGVALAHHAELEQGLRDFFAQRDIVPTATIMRQAYLPAGAAAIPNAVGTAPGVRAETGAGRLIFAVPGVPREMRAMIDESVIPALLERLEGERSVIVSRVLRAFGIGESALAEPLEDILTTSENPTVAPLIYGNTEVHLRLTAKARGEGEAKAVLDAMEAKIRGRVGEHIFGSDDESLPSVVIAALAERAFSVAVAESVTGGIVSSLLTDVPGASRVLHGGVVAYSPAMKLEVLGVPRAVLEEHGVVSAGTVAAMAEGVRRVCRTHIGLATTGEAGPAAATDAPVGTVFIGLSDGNATHTFERRFFGDREIIRKRAALTAIDVLRRHLLKHADSG